MLQIPVCNTIHWQRWPAPTVSQAEEGVLSLGPSSRYLFRSSSHRRPHRRLLCHQTDCKILFYCKAPNINKPCLWRGIFSYWIWSVSLLVKVTIFHYLNSVLSLQWYFQHWYGWFFSLVALLFLYINKFIYFLEWYLIFLVIVVRALEISFFLILSLIAVSRKAPCLNCPILKFIQTVICKTYEDMK